MTQHSFDERSASRIGRVVQRVERMPQARSPRDFMNNARSVGGGNNWGLALAGTQIGATSGTFDFGVIERAGDGPLLEFAASQLKINARCLVTVTVEFTGAGGGDHQYSFKPSAGAWKLDALTLRGVGSISNTRGTAATRMWIMDASTVTFSIDWERAAGSGVTNQVVSAVLKAEEV